MEEVYKRMAGGTSSPMCHICTGTVPLYVAQRGEISTGIADPDQE
jgi:hypothetical protein